METQVISRGNSAGVAVASVVAVWGALITVASLTGLLHQVPPFAVAPAIVIGMVAPSIWYFRSRELQALVAGIGLRRVTLFHLWRIGPALLIFWYGAHGLLPRVFVERAGGGDLVIGILAPLVVGLAPWRWAYGAFHVLGLADLLVAIGTAMALTMVSATAMQHIGDFPVALIPLFGVGITATTHAMAFDLLRRGKTVSRGV
jgi:hypothetical protein